MVRAKIFLILILFSVSNLYSQLEMSISTDKSRYEYGETIILTCTVTNPADTTFEYLASTWGSCHASFKFNDFDSKERERCALSSQMLVFNPYSSLVYKWHIDPMYYGLPNKDGVQEIVGEYFFDLTDTIYVNAPLFLGGQLSVGYDTSNMDYAQHIRDSLGVVVFHQSDYGDNYSEQWQIEGHQIDSLVSDFKRNTLFNYFEKHLWIEYDSMEFENLPDYFPLQIGNRWQYKEYGVDIEESRAIGDTTMPISKTYTKIIGALFSGYYRKEGNKVYSYNTYKSEEELRYDFSLNEGDTLSIEIHDQDTLITWVSSTGYSEIFGDTRNYIEYTRGWVNATEDIYKKFIDGIGFSENSGGMLFYGLTGTVIDGKRYGTIVSVENNDETVPTKYSLDQNYPNPFNPSTTLSYSIPTNGKVELKVYDALGREVATIVNKEQSAGSYEVEFDASSLTSGIYFYQLRAGGFVESRKMVLIK